MNEIFINQYIENLAKEVTELNKVKIMLQTQLDIANEVNKQLTDELNNLKEQIEKQGKKKKEVNTSDETF